MTNRTRKTTGAVIRLRFTKTNYALLAGGIASVAAGYALLAGGSTVAAPLLLVLGYVVLIPWGIMK